MIQPIIPTVGSQQWRHNPRSDSVSELFFGFRLLGAFHESAAVARMAFVRNFDHVDGNWAGHLSFSGNNLRISSIISVVSLFRGLKAFIDTITCHYLTSSECDPSKFVRETSLHISLSKSFILRHYQIDPFLLHLTSILPPPEMFDYSLIKLIIRRIHFDLEIYCEYFICYNEAKTRKFLCIPVADHNSSLAKLTGVFCLHLWPFSQTAGN
jgi:hypothetical protein